MTATAPLCPTCGQPASEGLAGGDAGWECRNESCAEFGQPVREQEPPPSDPPEPGRSAGRIP